MGGASAHLPLAADVTQAGAVAAAGPDNVRKPPETPHPGEWRRVLDVNVTGYVLCTGAVGSRTIGRGSGCVINAASIMGARGSVASGESDSHVILHLGLFLTPTSVPRPLPRAEAQSRGCVPGTSTGYAIR